MENQNKISKKLHITIKTYVNSIQTQMILKRFRGRASCCLHRLLGVETQDVFIFNNLKAKYYLNIKRFWSNVTMYPYNLFSLFQWAFLVELWCIKMNNCNLHTFFLSTTLFLFIYIISHKYFFLFILRKKGLH